MKEERGQGKHQTVEEAGEFLLCFRSTVFSHRMRKEMVNCIGILTVSLLPTLVSHCALQPSTPLFTRPVNDITIT